MVVGCIILGFGNGLLRYSENVSLLSGPHKCSDSRLKFHCVLMNNYVFLRL